MKVGLYTGCFDPFTLGHFWIVDQALSVFDKLYVLIGKHPKKKSLFTEEERINQILATISNEWSYDLPELVNKLVVDVVSKPIYEHVSELVHANTTFEITLVRGLRHEADFDYEASIARDHAVDGLRSIFMIPPDLLENVSSSIVKSWCEAGLWENVLEAVPLPVYEALQLKYPPQYAVTTPQVASMFETTTAGFAPAPYPEYYEDDSYAPRGIAMQSSSGHTFAPMDDSHSLQQMATGNRYPGDDCNSLCQMASGDANLNMGNCQDSPNLMSQLGIMDLDEEGISRLWMYLRESLVKNKTHNFFNILSKNKLVNCADVITCNQVKELLDPFPYDVVVSDTFHLREIPIDAVKPLGDRYLFRSLSVGPIVVEANSVIGDDSELGQLGPVIIIEGKHRWLDAKDRGDKTIMAWVGKQALEMQCNI